MQLHLKVEIAFPFMIISAAIVSESNSRCVFWGMLLATDVDCK